MTMDLTSRYYLWVNYLFEGQLIVCLFVNIDTVHLHL